MLDTILSEEEVDLSHLISAIQFSYITENKELGEAVEEAIKLCLEVELEKDVSKHMRMQDYLKLINMEVNAELTSLAHDCFTHLMQTLDLAEFNNNQVMDMMENVIKSIHHYSTTSRPKLIRFIDKLETELACRVKAFTLDEIEKLFYLLAEQINNVLDNYVGDDVATAL